MHKYRFENTKALAFASIMSSISIVLVLLTYFTGDIGLFLIFLLPLCASLVAVNVNFKYSLIYIVATFLISCIDFQLALFIIIPCLISGLVFGKLIKWYTQGYFIIIIDSLILTLLQIGATVLVELIYGVDLVESISSIFKIKFEVFSDTYFLFLFMISLIECSLDYMIITSELKKLNYEFNEKKDRFILVLILESTMVSLSLLMMFFFKEIAYLLLGISVFMGIVLAYYNFSYYVKKIFTKVQIIFLCSSFIIALVVLSYIPRSYAPFLFLIPLLSIIITSLLIIIYQKIIKKSKIDPSIFEKLD